MSKNYKFWTALLAFVPFVIMIVYITYLFSFIFYVMRHNMQGTDTGDMRDFIGLFILAMIMAVTGMAGFIFFLIHAINNKAIDSNERLVWILVFIFASVFSFPIYWYMRIFKTTSSTPAPVTQ
jgi:hypothetical protein